MVQTTEEDGRSYGGRNSGGAREEGARPLYRGRLVFSHLGYDAKKAISSWVVKLVYRVSLSLDSVRFVSFRPALSAPGFRQLIAVLSGTEMI